MLSPGGAAVKMKTADFRTKIVYPGVPEKSDRLFGERRSSGMIESTRKLVLRRGRERYEACDDEASEKSRRKQTI